MEKDTSVSPRGQKLYERAENDKSRFKKKQRKSRHEIVAVSSAGGVKKYFKRACFFFEDDGHIACLIVPT